MTKIGRNAPCPCGSGVKYKRCCLGKDEFKEAMQAQNFENLEDAQAFADQLAAARNQTGVDDFAGLSPEQMSGLLYAPFSSPGLVDFPATLAITPEAPLLTMFQLIAEHCGDGGIKLTATGRLPRKICIAAAELIEVQHGMLFTPLGKGRLEDDILALMVTRIAGEEAKLLSKRKGMLTLTAQGKSLVAAGPKTLYPALLKAISQRYNWAYTDGFPELSFIQQSFVYSLYLLSRYGDEPRKPEFYSDAFLRAFPSVLAECNDREYMQAESQVRYAFDVRVLERFAALCGLVHFEKKWHLGENLSEIRKTALLDAAVKFPLKFGQLA